MRNSIYFLTAAILLFTSCVYSQDRHVSTPAEADHITREMWCDLAPCHGDTIPDQIRYLIGHWPRAFEIAVVEATEEPKCGRVGDSTDCSARVKPIELILGHRESLPNGSRRPQSWNDSYVIDYLLRTPKPSGSEPAGPNLSFDVKQGNRLVAFLTPAMQPPGKPVLFIATRLDPCK
jgi:hypothetical protein